MKLRLAYLALACLAVLLVLVPGGRAYVEERYTLARVVNESTNIVLVKVKRVNKERKLIIYDKVADIKGKHPSDVIKHNVGVGGFNVREQTLPTEWAAEGKLALFFHNGGASETCIGKYWYQAYAGGEWWNHSHGEPYLCRTFCGEVEALKEAVEKLLKNEDVMVPATVSKTDLRIQKVLATMKKPLDYIIVEPPKIEKTTLTDVAGFSEMIELPRPPGRLQGAIPVDFDGDGFTDLLIVGSNGLCLLRNNQKGNFEEVTHKWGLSEDQGGHSVACADYNRSGRPSLLTSDGKLYTNLGDKFKDDTALLPETPKRVPNPGEALAWVDVDGDGLPDIVSSVGSKGLAVWRNTGGAGGKWFEDISERAGFGPEGLGQDPASFLNALDLDGDGKVDLVLTMEQPLLALNKNGVFKQAPDLGIQFPGLPRPALALGDYRNDGKPGLFITATTRPGGLAEWMMLGTLSPDEDKTLNAGPDLAPGENATVKIGKDSWTWQSVKARSNGTLEIARDDPSPNATYAFTTFEWSKAEPVTLYIGCQHALTAWVNGKPVYEFKGKRPFAPDAEGVPVDVKQGKNTLLLKALDDDPVWRTSVRVSPLNLYPPPAVRLLKSDGKGKFTDVTLQSGDLAQLRSECISAVWGDVDSDGLLDLIVTDKNGLVRVYRNQGDGKFRYVTHELGIEQKFKASGVVAADFNNDGRLDLVLLGANREPSVILVSKVKGKHAPLTVRFAGPESPIGATVRLLSADGKLAGTHSIAGGDGRTMQAAPEARFVAPPGKYKVEVRYSSGKVRGKMVDLAEKPLWETIDEKTPVAAAK
jgi:hypothetical protein